MSGPLNPKYCIYPSLLDRFSAYLNPGKLLDYGKTEEEIEQELLNAINRVPFESEAAEKGTAFNLVVDQAIKTGTADLFLLPEITLAHKSRLGNEYIFKYPSQLIVDFAEYFNGAVSQVFCLGYIETRYGLVKLYGYADEVKGSTVYDIKTTGNYDFPKYLSSWQRHIYPYCLRQQSVYVDSFEFVVTDFKNIYKEFYQYKHEESETEIRLICEWFIEFIEARIGVITDKRIFNQ